MADHPCGALGPSRERELDRAEVDALVVAVHALAVAFIALLGAEQPEAVGGSTLATQYPVV